MHIYAIIATVQAIFPYKCTVLSDMSTYVSTMVTLDDRLMVG